MLHTVEIVDGQNVARAHLISTARTVKLRDSLDHQLKHQKSLLSLMIYHLLNSGL